MYLYIYIYRNSPVIIATSIRKLGSYDLKFGCKIIPGSNDPRPTIKGNRC